MTLIRLTIRPWETVDVDDRELEDLIRQGLVYTMASRLYVNFYTYRGGPSALVTSVTVKITKDGVTMVDTTSAGVTEIEQGSYFYDWSENDRAGAGDYVIHWEAVDETDTTVTAEETITLEE